MSFFNDLTEYIIYWLEKIGEPLILIWVGILISQFLLK